VNEPVLTVRPDDDPTGLKHVALYVLLMVVTDVLDGNINTLSCKCSRNCEFHLLFLFVVTYFWALGKKAISWYISFWKIIAVIVASQKQAFTFVSSNCYCRLTICNIMAVWSYFSYLFVGTTIFTTDIWTFRFHFMVPVYFMIRSKQFMYEAVRTAYWVIRTKDDSLTLRLHIYIYIYVAPILDVSRSHTTTHHSP